MRTLKLNPLKTGNLRVAEINEKKDVKYSSRTGDVYEKAGTYKNGCLKKRVFHREIGPFAQSGPKPADAVGVRLAARFLAPRSPIDAAAVGEHGSPKQATRCRISASAAPLGERALPFQADAGPFESISAGRQAPPTGRRCTGCEPRTEHFLLP